MGAVGISTQIGVIVSILLYGFVLSRFIAERYHFIANVCAASLSVAGGLALGLSVNDMGLGLHVVPRGIAIAAVVSAAIMLTVFITASISPLRRYFTLMQHMEPNRIAYETAVRIPLSTALSEEVLFRGALLGLLFTHYSMVGAVVIGSIVFGLWHILPSLSRYHSQDEQKVILSKIPYAAATVCATAVAGIFFSWLRIVSGSIIAPWLMHWSINSSAMLASAFVARRQHPPTMTKDS